MGGIYDPKTGTIEWTFHVPLDEQVVFYRAHPPSCLAGLTAKPIDLDFTFDGHGEPVNAIFEVSCSCGNALFIAACTVEEDTIRAPITLECAGCDAEHVIYDPSRHGYDALAGGLPADELSDDSYADELTPETVDMPHHVIVRFEFPSDHLGGPDHQGREQDLFSWITILARDPKTGEIAFLFDDECA